MLSPRWRKVIADLGANLTRTSLAVLSIAVGVFGIGMVAGASVLTSRDLGGSYAAANPYAIEVRAWPGFDDELLGAVRRTPGVADAVGVGLTTVRAEVAPGEWRNLILFAVDDLEGRTVNRVRPNSGAWPVADRAILLERSGRSSVSFPEGALLSDVVGTSFVGNPLPPAYSLGGAALWLLAVVVMAVLASALPARRASQLTVRDVLAYE